MTNDSPICVARSFLFVPGDRPERFDKALSSGADAVVLDVEDAVGLDKKADARDAISRYSARPRSSGPAVLVRINSTATSLGRDDLEWLKRTAGIDGLLVPKAESGVALAAVARDLPALALVAIVESARGLLNVREVAHAAGVVRLAFGHLDFMADTGIRPGADESELSAARLAIVLASRDAALPAPIDGVTVEIQDDGRLATDVARSIRAGFQGKLCIHPRQITGVHQAFAPSAEELAWARRVIAADQASEGGAVQVDGRMVDAPVVLRARKTLELHRRFNAAG